MAIRNTKLNLTAMSLAAVGFMAIPCTVFAQDGNAGNADTGSSEQLNKPIDLNVKSGSLFYALTLLFDQLKVNYSLPEGLKQIEVSAHFTKLPIRTALETLLKNSGYTYKVDGGVYSVVAREIERPNNPLPPENTSNEPIDKTRKIYRLASNQITYSAAAIVTHLGGRVLPPSAATPPRLGSGNGFGSGGLGSGGFGSAGLGSGLGGGLGGFGSGNGFSSGGSLVGGGGYYGGANNFGGGNNSGRRGGF